MAEMATKSSPAPLQNHWLGGCTIDMAVEVPSAWPYRLVTRFLVITYGATFLCFAQT